MDRKRAASSATVLLLIGLSLVFPGGGQGGAQTTQMQTTFDWASIAKALNERALQVEERFCTLVAITSRKTDSA